MPPNSRDDRDRALVWGGTEDEAAAYEPIEQQQALVIGIDAYGPGLANLGNAANDARAVAQLLKHDYGFDLIPGDGQPPLLNERAALDRIRQTVERSLAQAGPATRWLFYFAGHGLVQAGQGYLIPADATAGQVETFLPLRWLLDTCLASRCGELLIVLDACYSGQALLAEAQLSDQIPVQGDSDRVRQIITSGNPDQPVLDGGGSGHSIFSQALLEALAGWAGIHDVAGVLPFAALLAYLKQEVRRRLVALDRAGSPQQPLGGNLVGNRSGREFVLPARVPRLSPQIVQGLRGDEPARRRQELQRLIAEVGRRPETRALAVDLATQHLRAEPGQHASRLVTGLLYYEPEAEVRAQAAQTLGDLGDRAAVEPLLAALHDRAPVVCRAAAQALGQLAEPGAAGTLLDRLGRAEGELFLDLAGAIGASGDQAKTLAALAESLRRKWLVPFVGPDFPQALTGLPDRLTVARELARRENLPAAGSLAEVAAATMRGANRSTFTQFLKEQLEAQLASPGPIHHALAQLDLPFWISGAYDDLLIRALGARAIVTGQDTIYWQPGPKTVVRLAGDLSSQQGLLVLAGDYARLREGEEERRLLIEFLRQQLAGKLVLFLGYDPRSPDFELLREYVLNRHLAGLALQPFLVWPTAAPGLLWGDRPIRAITGEGPDFVVQLAPLP